MKDHVRVVANANEVKIEDVSFNIEPRSLGRCPPAYRYHLQVHRYKGTSYPASEESARS